MFSQACDHFVPVTISLRQFPEQRHSEDISLSTPIVHVSMSALSLVTERVSPEAQGQYVVSLALVAMLPVLSRGSNDKFEVVTRTCF